MKRSNQTKLTFRIGPKSTPDREEIITPDHVIEEGNLALHPVYENKAKAKPTVDRWPYENIEEEEAAPEPHLVEVIPHRSQTEDFNQTRERSKEMLDRWFHEEKDLSDVTHSSLYSSYFHRGDGPIIDDEVYRGSGPRKRVPILRYFVSVGGAVLTGFLMGLALLSFVVEDGEIGNLYSSYFGEEAPQGTATGEASGEAATGQGDPATTNPATYPMPVSWVDQPYYMVQAGVFADDTGAEAMIQTLAGQGYPGLLLPTSKDFRVYVGTAGTKEDAVIVAGELKERGIDVYVKDFAIPGAQQIELASEGNAELITTFLSDGDRLYKALSHWQSNVLNGTEAGGESLKPELQQWITQLGGFRSFLSSDQQMQLDQMVIYMKEAVALQEDYLRDPVVTHVWRAQGELMNYIVTTQKWVQSLSSVSTTN